MIGKHYHAAESSRLPRRTRSAGRRAGASALLVLLSALAAGSGGCATIRVTDPPRTATEEFLISGAAVAAVNQLSIEALRDRMVFLDTQFLTNPTIAAPGAPFLVGQPTPDQLFLIGELRAKLLRSGVRLTDTREQSDVVMEIRSGGLSIDHLEFLLGLPAGLLGGALNVGGVPVTTPELAIIKSTKQRGYASVAFIAYWRKTGELIAESGPYVGRTLREDFWFFGTGPKTVGNIPPAEK